LDKSPKGIDGYHSRWILARHHKGEWEDKPLIINEEQETKITQSMDAVSFLQSKAAEVASDLNNADSNINSAEKS